MTLKAGVEVAPYWTPPKAPGVGAERMEWSYEVDRLVGAVRRQANELRPSLGC